MKLTQIRIKDFRSFGGEHTFEVGETSNFFVGPNNCGKSNLIGAVELALDTNSEYLVQRDRPSMSSGVGAPRRTRITLTFRAGSTGPEKTLLARAKEYELAVIAQRSPGREATAKTFADQSEVRLITTFDTGGARITSFGVSGAGASSLSAADDKHVRLESQFRDVVRFAVVHSGEDLQSLLRGKFREILHLVIRDHLGAEMVAAEAAREKYVTDLKSQLLEPLRVQIEQRVSNLFSEIGVATLVPEVPTLAETLSSVDVQLSDIATTQLKGKGTGVRGAVLLAMLQYLAEQSRRSLVLAIEEPEAFLHPGAQEMIRDHLDDLAGRRDVSLLVTSHSPYVISRGAGSLVTELHKLPTGETKKRAVLEVEEDRWSVLSSLYRDSGLSQVVERSLSVPSWATAVLVTEGYTDGHFLRSVCAASGNERLIEGLHIVQAGGASKVVPMSILTGAATSLPVIALIDHDANGRAAADKLKAFGWSDKKEVLSLRKWPRACTRGHDIEIEDLLPTEFVTDLIEKLGERRALDGKTRCGSGWHFQCSSEWKDAAIDEIEKVRVYGEGGFVWLGEEIGRRRDLISGNGARHVAPV